MYLVWILLYELLYMASEVISNYFKLKNWGIVVTLIIYIYLLLKWLKWTRKKDAIALKYSEQVDKRMFLYYFPLLVLPIYNCIVVEKEIIDISLCILVFCVAMIEEIFFRGVLYDLLVKWSKCGYIVLSSLLFSLFHLMNIYDGMDFSYVFFQTLSAFAIGISYAAIVVCEKSIYPCIMSHFLINVTSGNNLQINIEKIYSFELYGLCICMIVHIVYGIWIYKKYERKLL